MVGIVDWTNVLDTLIAASPAIIGAIVAAFYSHRVHKQIQLPSGKAMGEAMEYTHDTAIANNLLLARDNSTKTADHRSIEIHGSLPPQIPDKD